MSFELRLLIAYQPVGTFTGTTEIDQSLIFVFCLIEGAFRRHRFCSSVGAQYQILI